MQEIRLIPKKSNIVIGSILLLLCIILVCLLIPNVIEEGEDGVFLLIGVGVVVILPLGLIGCGLTFGSIKSARKMRAILDQYGEEKIRYHIKNATIATYNNQVTNKVMWYFTEAFILMPQAELIDYQMIDQMYRKEVAFNHSTTVSICLQKKDGEFTDICTGIRDDQITYFMQIIINHNPYILMGNSEENRQQHLMHVQAYKNGNITIPRMNLDLFGQSMNDMGNIQPQTYGNEDVCNYIRQNFSSDQIIYAIKYYREQTGVPLKEAKDVVDHLFAPNPVLQEPYEWSQAGQKQKLGDKFKMIGVTLLILYTIAIVTVLIVGITGSADTELILAFLVGSIPVLLLGILMLVIGKKNKVG